MKTDGMFLALKTDKRVILLSGLLLGASIVGFSVIFVLDTMFSLIMMLINLTFFTMAFLFTWYVLVSKEGRVHSIAKWKKLPLLLNEDGTGNLKFIIPKVDGTRYETKTMLFELLGHPPSRMGGVRVFTTITGFGRAISFGVAKAAQEMNKVVQGDFDPREIIEMPEVVTKYRLDNMGNPVVDEEGKPVLEQHTLTPEEKCRMHILPDVNGGQVITAGALLPAYGIVDLKAILNYIDEYRPATAMKQYNLNVQALEKFNIPPVVKSYFKYFFWAMMFIILGYFVMTLFQSGTGAGFVEGMKSSIPGGGGIGRP